MTETTKQETTPPELRNPDGKGGFRDNPQNRHNGAWRKTETFRYWFDLFKEMTVTQLKQWLDENPENTRTVAADLAHKRVMRSYYDLKEFQEVANRSEGMPKQVIETSNINEEYDKYLETCKEHGIDPSTGLRVAD